MTGCPQLQSDWRIGLDGASGESSTGQANEGGEAAIETDAEAGLEASGVPEMSDAGIVCAPEDGSTVYHDMTSSSLWSAFDVATVNANAKGFWGAAFDGRYVYFVPALSSIVARYDSAAALNSPSSWTTFDTMIVNARAKSFNGASFDGRYVYFVPHDSGSSGLVTRYDTQQDFAAASSWGTFDTSALNQNVKSFSGATFDGQYVYLAPNPGSMAVRYDTKATFGSASSWSVFDVGTTNPIAKGFAGGVFDGRFVYFISSSVARYDTRAAFTSAAAWMTFDVTMVSPNAKALVGAAFDGRYIYIAPLQTSGGVSDGVVVRYDVTATFSAPTSWSAFDTTALNMNAKNYDGALFDGRYVYIVPQATGFDDVVARFDTKATFSAITSWTTFDTTAGAGAGGFVGGAFDGRYLYFAPYARGPSYSGVVARFDAKTPPSLPCLPAFKGSFL